MTSYNQDMNDAEKLNLIADWIDLKYPNDHDPEVQDDLRRMARQLLALGGNIPLPEEKERMHIIDTWKCPNCGFVYSGLQIQSMIVSKEKGGRK